MCKSNSSERIYSLYAAVLFVKENRNKLLKMYTNLIHESLLTVADLVREDQQEELLYSLFTYTNKRSHRKVRSITPPGGAPSSV